jgi:outer membrane protein assembly factor BamB
MPSRTSRATGAPLDPYGIYGTRTQARLRASRRQRQTQNILLIVIVLAVFALVFALSRWRREKTDVALLRIETGAAMDMAPLFAPATKTSGAALMIANRDGVLLRYDDIENPENEDAQNAPKKTVLLRDDFPLHAPLLAGDKLFVPSESGVLTALLWRDKKVLWRKKFDDALTAQPVAFSIARPAPADAPASPVVPDAIGEAAPVPVASMPATRQVVAAASDAGLVMAIDIGSGQMLWRARMPAPIGNGLTAVEANGRARVLVPLLGGTAMRGGVWCLDGASGKVLWRFPNDARAEAIQFAPPLADLPDNRAYFGNDLGAVFALNLTTGNHDAKKKVGWKRFVLSLDEDSPTAVLLRAAPLLVDSPNKQNKLLLLGGSDGVVRALAVGNGSTLWRYKTKEPILSLLHVRASGEPDRVLVVSQSSQLVILDGQTGQVTRRLSGGGEVFAGASVSTQHIFATTEDGAIHRFKLTK